MELISLVVKLANPENYWIYIILGATALLGFGVLNRDKLANKALDNSIDKVPALLDRLIDSVDKLSTVVDRAMEKGFDTNTLEHVGINSKLDLILQKEDLILSQLKARKSSTKAKKSTTRKL